MGIKMRKVYILNDGGLDYSDAERFGALEICTQGSIDRADVSKMYRLLDDALLDSHPEDFLIVAGLNSLIAIAASIMAHRHGEVHFLVHKDGKYVQRDLMLENG